MIGRTNTGGKGGGLNFKVVGNPQPASPSENTIWLNTDVPISKWYFNATQPENLAEGDVWFPIGTSSPAEFNALKKNGIQVYPLSAKQYAGGAWVDVPAMAYQNGAWVDIKMYLFNKGVVNSLLTGGIYGTNDGTALVQESTTFTPGQNKNYTTKNKVDLTGFSRVKVRFTSTNTTNLVLFRMFVDDKSCNGAAVPYTDFVAYLGKNGPFNGGESEYELSLVGVTGSYYLGWGMGVSSNSEENKRVNGKVLEWWLE